MTSNTLRWDEPAQAASPRGWLMTGGTCTGFYLDYGPDSHRSPHQETLNTVNGPRVRVWCEPGRECRDCQPGNILACRYPDGPGSPAKRSRYVETVEQAREWVESGELAQHAAQSRARLARYARSDVRYQLLG